MARYQKREFRLGDDWLSQKGNSPAWYRTWYDAKARQTKRSSLGTTDFDEAKEKLTDWFVLSKSSKGEKADEVLIAEVLARYWEHHGKLLRSVDQTKIGIKYWLEFYQERTVAELSVVDLQESFHRWLTERGLKGSSISRILTVGRAAVNRAWKRGEIASVPYIHNISSQKTETAMPRGRPLEVEELGRLFSASQTDALKTFLIMMIATTGRPEAILQLTLDRCDTDNRIIELNQKGRAQTTKYRPSVRMPEVCMEFVHHLKEAHGNVHIVGLRDAPIKTIRASWLTARRFAQLDDQVNPYSLRHTMARWLRKSGVSAWEVSAQLGHKRREMSVTETYAPHDPAYLSASVKAIDSFFAELRANCVSVDEFLKSKP